MCLVYIVMCVYPLQVVTLLCTLLYSTVECSVVPHLYFKPRMSGSKSISRIESSQEPEPVLSILLKWNFSSPSMSYCWQSFSSTISHLLPSSSQQHFLLVHSLPVPAPVHCTTVLFKVLYCKIKCVYFLCFFFMYYLCEKNYKPITV